MYLSLGAWYLDFVSECTQTNKSCQDDVGKNKLRNCNRLSQFCSDVKPEKIERGAHRTDHLGQ